MGRGLLYTVLFKRGAGPNELLADLHILCIVFNDHHMIHLFFRSGYLNDGDYILRNSFSLPFTQ